MTPNELLDKAIEITQKRKNFIYKEPLRLNIETIKKLHFLANNRGIAHQEWLPSISLWLSIEFARSNHHENSKLPCSLTKYSFMQDLATLLEINDDWKSGIKIV